MAARKCVSAVRVTPTDRLIDFCMLQMAESGTSVSRCVDNLLVPSESDGSEIRC